MLVYPTGIPTSSSGYTIENAVWFEPGSDTLVKTFSGAGTSNKKSVISWWEKKLGTGDTYATFHTPAMYFLYETSNEYRLRWNGTITTAFQTNAVYRDYGAWTHHVLDVDTTQATDTNRLRKFTNGVLDTLKSTSYPAQDATWDWNQAVQHNIPQTGGGPGLYLAEFINLDGQSIIGGDLAITDLVDTDSNGVPVPVDPSGLDFTGNNSFWLDFAVAPGTGNGAGTDVSGNGNHFTDTSMTAAQQVTDSPTDDADNDIGNFSNINANTPTAITLSEGNQRCAGTDQKLIGNIAVTRGSGVKLVVEFEIVAVANWSHLGMIGLDGSLAEQYWDNDGTWRLNYNSAGNFQFGGSDSSAPASYTTGDFIRMEADFNANSLEFFKNGVSQGGFAIPAGYDQWVWGKWLQGSGGDVRINTGQRAWNNTPTAGFVGWGTANLAAPTVTDPSQHYQSEIVAHDGTSTAFTLNWDADVNDTLFIIKNRDSAESWFWVNGVRGYDKYVKSDAISNETTDSNVISVSGTTITLGSTLLNDSYIVMCYKAGLSASRDTTNSEGTLTGASNSVIISANTVGGFSIITYAGNGTAAQSFGHGLDEAPEFWGVFQIDGAANSHDFGHVGLGGTKRLLIDNTTAPAISGTWNNTLPSSTVINIDSNGAFSQVNENTKIHMALAWHRVPGLIGIGTYTGNNAADGTYVVVDDGASGFRPACVLVKRLEAGYAWHLVDSARNPYNPTAFSINPNDTAGDATTNAFDFTANGFKLRTTDGGFNGAQTYIYLAFAENPFGGSGVAQARAR